MLWLCIACTFLYIPVHGVCTVAPFPLFVVHVARNIDKLYNIFYLTNMYGDHTIKAIPSYEGTLSGYDSQLFKITWVFRHIVCLTTYPYPLPKRVLRRVLTSASFFSFQYFLFLRQSSGFLTFFRRLSVPSVFPVIRSILWNTCYKSEGLWFNSRWYHWNFSLT